ncbi:MAG: EAL domain-containing protein [Nocardioidaceae bacterium]
MSDLESVLKGVVAPADDSPESSRAAVQEWLVALRVLLGTEVAFVSRFADGRRYFDYVDTEDGFKPFAVGDSDPLETTYCARVADGRMDQLVPDAAAVPSLRQLAVTTELPVGAHLSVPIVDAEGGAVGTLCCFSRVADHRLRARDLELMNVFGGLISRHLHRLVESDRRVREVREAVGDVLDAGGPNIALQPIVDVVADRTAGYEALARFPQVDGRSWGPDRWFTEAEGIGLGIELETSAVAAALRLLGRLPRRTTLSVNVSARSLCASDDVVKLLPVDASRVVVELTEHSQVDDYDLLLHTLERVRASGARIAVDDAGSGYAGLEHILRLQPEVLKLDRTLVQGVAVHPGRQAMCVAMVGFTERMRSSLVAEGVETRADLDTLAGLGVPLAQGYFLGRPKVPEAGVPVQRGNNARASRR